MLKCIHNMRVLKYEYCEYERVSMTLCEGEPTTKHRVATIWNPHITLLQRFASMLTVESIHVQCTITNLDTQLCTSHRVLSSLATHSACKLQPLKFMLHLCCLNNTKVME